MYQPSYSRVVPTQDLRPCIATLNPTSMLPHFGFRILNFVFSRILLNSKSEIEIEIPFRHCVLIAVKQNIA